MAACFPDPMRVCSPHNVSLRIILALALLILFSVGVRATPPAPPAALVKEINLTEGRFGQSGLVASDFVAAGNRVFFRGADPEDGNELWVSDGTAAGTRLVIDLDAGRESSWFPSMVGVGDRLFFSAWGEQTPARLWVSDGTIAGTVGLADVMAEQLTDVNGRVFFTVSSGLWRSDGTTNGTTEIMDFSAGSPMNLTNIAGKLFFTASDEVHGRELWTSDGTAAGTKMVADLNPDGDSFSQPGLAELTPVGSTLYFVTTEESLLYQLWRSDGTVASTKRVTSAGPIELIGAVELENVAGTLYFHGLGRVDEMTWSNGLWKTDGSAPGTIEIKSFSTGAESLSGAPAHLVGTSSQLFFAGSGSTLWRSDGTPGGTFEIDAVSVDEGSFTGVGDASGRLFFAGSDASGDVELWVSGGTTSSTQRVKDINTAKSSVPGFLTRFGNMVLFSANDWQIWRSDGTEAGTFLVKDPAVVPLGIYGYPLFGPDDYEMAGALGKLFFAANDGVHGRELWVSDGTAGGTHIVKDIEPTGSSSPLFLTPFGTSLYFMTGDPTSFMLWKTDGTEIGTTIVKSFIESRIPLSGGLTKVGGAMYFLARDSIGDKLWTSNGTLGGTVPVASLPAADRYPADLVGVNGRLFFVATDSAHGRELWTSDGTAAGTGILKDILSGVPPYNTNSNPFGLSAVGNTLFFMAWGGQGYELWKSDGSSSGTVRVTALALDNTEAIWDPSSFTPAGSQLFFTTGLLRDGDPRLWVSDGTAAGTAVVKNSAGYPVAAPLGMSALNGRLLFSQNYSPYGRELWASDGSPSGTTLLKDINPGPASSTISGIRQVRSDGWALFAASAGPDGVELWQTDGTVAHTQQLQDLAPGASSSNPMNFVGAGGRVYFIADDGSTGPELWSLSQSIFSDLPRFKRYVPLVAR